MLYGSLDGRGVEGPWIHVYVWLSPFAVHLKLTTLLISYEVTVIQLCPTLYNPMDCSPPGSSVHEFSRQEYWSGLPCPPPGDLPNPGIELKSPAAPALMGGFFTTESPGKPCFKYSNRQLVNTVLSAYFWKDRHGKSELWLGIN